MYIWFTAVNRKINKITYRLKFEHKKFEIDFDLDFPKTDITLVLYRI